MMTKRKLLIIVIGFVLLGTAAGAAVFFLKPEVAMDVVDEVQKEAGVKKESAKDYTITWSKDFTSIDIEYPEGHYKVPEDAFKKPFPKPGKKPVFDFDVKWPYVIMSARWSMSVKGWPQNYRSDILDLVLMFATDAALYQYMYPKYVLSSKFSFPEDHVRESEAILQGKTIQTPLIEEERGKSVQYEVKIKGGLGASDIKMKTDIKVGSTKDLKTVFYYDEPEYISDYLTDRDFFFIAHDAGDAVNFEAAMACVCAPRGFFKDAVLDRIKKSHEYFIERSYEIFKDPMSEQEIEQYLGLVQRGYSDLDKVKIE